MKIATPLLPAVHSPRWPPGAAPASLMKATIYIPVSSAIASAITLSECADCGTAEPAPCFPASQGAPEMASPPPLGVQMPMHCIFCASVRITCGTLLRCITVGLGGAPSRRGRRLAASSWSYLERSLRGPSGSGHSGGVHQVAIASTPLNTRWRLGAVIAEPLVRCTKVEC